MTQKDYIKIAKVLNGHQPFNETTELILDPLFFAIADMLAEDNPHFDREKFFRAIYK